MYSYLSDDDESDILNLPPPPPVPAEPINYFIPKGQISANSNPRLPPSVQAFPDVRARKPKMFSTNLEDFFSHSREPPPPPQELRNLSSSSSTASDLLRARLERKKPEPVHVTTPAKPKNVIPVPILPIGDSPSYKLGPIC